MTLTWMTEEISYSEFAPSLLTALVRKCTHNPFPLLITLLLLRYRSSYKNYVWWLAILVSAQIFFHFLRLLSYMTLISATDSCTWMPPFLWNIFAFASSPYEFIYLFDIVLFSTIISCYHPHSGPTWSGEACPQFMLPQRSPIHLEDHLFWVP